MQNNVPLPFFFKLAQAGKNSREVECSVSRGVTVFFENLSRKFKFHTSVTRITSTLHEYQ